MLHLTLDLLALTGLVSLVLLGLGLVSDYLLPALVRWWGQP